MASIVDICNLALAHLGNKAQVVSISPVDGSVEADYCARFYGIARDEILEMGDWTFARTRVALPLLANNPSSNWAYAYGKPSDMLVPRRILTGASASHEDDSVDFDIEGDSLFTNQANATLIYTKSVVDPTKFPTTFVTAVSYQLAGYLAGPILRGETGTTAAMNLHKIAAQKVNEAMAVDGNRSWRSDEYVPSMVAARGGQVPATAGGANPIIYPTSGYAIS